VEPGLGCADVRGNLFEGLVDRAVVEMAANVRAENEIVRPVERQERLGLEPDLPPDLAAQNLF
jgi:hypothetical protein